MPNAAGFPELEKLVRYLADLREYHASSLAHYYNRIGNGFLHMAGAAQKRDPSKSSTSTCVNSLVATSNWHSRDSSEPWIWERRIDQIYKKNLTGSWHSGGLKTKNAFTVAFVL